MCTHHDTSTLSGIRGLGASGGDRGCAVRLLGSTILLLGVGRILMVGKQYQLHADVTLRKQRDTGFP